MLFEIIAAIVIMLPLYAALIWTYLFPEESMLFGNRWMYRDRPEFSERAIRFTKFGASTGLIFLPIALISIIFDSNFIILLMFLGFYVYLCFGLYRLFTK
ncbi:hypothetical protein ACERII_05880 [Evansella sp. AB-rgal1]|uniref:hypothetical protein n=1 Tax=Evansella sp. AB-rgal1 TaxID=3242696 RepID=UPI00359CDBA9